MAAGADPVYTPETANGARLQGLLIDEGTALVRAVFDKEVSRMRPTSLQAQLQQQKSDLEGFLDPFQQEKVYPGGGTGVADSSKDFDIPLLSLLLGRLCHMRPPTTGWSRAPPLGDKSPIAWIIRLRLFRNGNYGHITNTALSDTKFQKLWKELSDILRGLGGDQNRILKRKASPIDPEKAKIYREKFDRLHQQDNEVKDLVVAQGAQAAAQLNSLADDVQRQTSEIKKKGKELRHIERTHGKQHKQVFDKLSNLWEGLKAMVLKGKKQSAEMKRAERETQSQLRTSIQQQQGLFEGQKSIIAGQKEIKTTVKETIDELKEELKEGQKPTCNVAEKAKPSAEGLTPTIEKLRNYLQDKYRTKLERIRPLPWFEDWYLDLGDMFTTLEMVRIRRDGQKEDNAVAVEDMFKLHNDCVPKTIRVEGDPGIGKTTLCYKIVYDWSTKKSKFEAHNRFSSFKLVLYAEMRQRPNDAAYDHVKSMIFQQAFPEAYYEDEEEFWKYVKCNPEDVLFVLDGLEEMPEETREKLKIAKFIGGEIMPYVHVIVTSRPYFCNDQLTSCNRHFVIKGYSRENIECYIHKHPKLDSNSKGGMLKQLNENASLHQLCKNPLNLAMLCIMWQKDWSEAELPQTLTGLYSLLVLAIVKRYAKKLRDSKSSEISNDEVSELSLEQMPEKIQGKLNDLSVLAYKGIEEDRFSFSRKAVKGLVEIGFLTNNLNLTTLIPQPLWFQFLHKTFQEYFAAKYLHSLCEATVNGEESSEASNVLKECIKYHDRYQQVIKFLAGLLGTNARCLFEAFHDSLSTNQDERIISLCLECLHECGAGTELVKYVSDVLPKDWTISSYVQILQTVDCITSPDKISHFYLLRNKNSAMQWPYLTSDCFGMYFLSCYTNIFDITDPIFAKSHTIISNDSLYGLVCLLHYQAKVSTGQDNTLLSNVLLQDGAENAACRFLKAIKDTKGIRVLAMRMADHDSEVNKIICQASMNDEDRDLPYKLSPYHCTYSSLNHMNNVLSLVQSHTEISLATSCSVKLDASFNSTDKCTMSRVIDTIARLGSRGGRDRKASVGLYIDCAAEMYISEFVSSSLADLVTTTKDCQDSCQQGRLELVVIVKNLPLAERPMIQSHLTKLSSILQDSNCFISRMTFECSCEDDSVVSTIPLLQSLALNQSLTEVSFLCDDPDNVARCLREIFSKNRTLQKLEIGFLHPVDDETMANIFNSYHFDSQCKITSFSVLMETGLNPPQTQIAVGTCNNNDLTYHKTAIAILTMTLLKSCIGSALQQISFRCGPGYIMQKTWTSLNSILKVTPVCPAFLLKPLIGAMLDSLLIVNLSGITWWNVADLQVTDDLFSTLTEALKNYLKMKAKLQQLYCRIDGLSLREQQMFHNMIQECHDLDEEWSEKKNLIWKAMQNVCTF